MQHISSISHFSECRGYQNGKKCHIKSAANGIGIQRYLAHVNNTFAMNLPDTKLIST